MKIRDQLIRKALIALDEVVEQARAGPVAPSFALAHLHVRGKGKRSMHDDFWRAMQRVEEVDADGKERWGVLATAFHYIQLDAG